MMNASPRASVALAVYNGEPYLEASVDSILSQDFTDFEFIIIDDGSTDGTKTLLERKAAQDPRIRLFFQANAGQTPSLNRGLSLARAPLIARQDADDLSLPGRLGRQVERMEGDPGIVLCSTHLRFIDGSGAFLYDQCRSPDDPAWWLHFANHLGGHSQVMMRREAIAAVDGYDESIRHTQDYDLWLRLLPRGRIVVIPEVLLAYRLHAGSMSHARREAQQAEHEAILQGFLSHHYGIEATSELKELIRLFNYGWPAEKRVDVRRNLGVINGYLWRVCRAYLGTLAPNERPATESRIRRAIANRHWEVLVSIHDGHRDTLPFRDILRTAWLAGQWHPLHALRTLKWFLSRGRRFANREAFQGAEVSS